jgi:Flp pilus assembly protein TadG
MTEPDVRGGAAVEMVILAPLLIAMFLFVIGLGRLATSRQSVDGAARDAAREASMARTEASAAQRARQVASNTLIEKKLSCSRMRIGVDTSRFAPVGGRAGSVTVHVDCTVANGDVILSGLPGSSTITGNFVAVVDAYRGTR